MTETVTIDARYNGPPRSGHGGYVCGLIAAHTDYAGALQVSLRAPPPLDAPLRLERTADGAMLTEGEQLIAEASAATLSGAVPPAPAMAEAELAGRRYVGFTQHAFPGCFACGPQRAEGDGLRIFVGPLADAPEDVAGPVVWPADVGDPEGRVPEEIIWAALDCPSAFVFDLTMPHVLARLAAQILERPTVEEHLIVRAWPLGTNGRKKSSGVALYGADGRLIAHGEALWIELKPEAAAVMTTA